MAFYFHLYSLVPIFSALVAVAAAAYYRHKNPVFLKGRWIPARKPLLGAFALLGALLGGLILNLMPCVFPVLAIKLLGFSRHSGEHGARHLRLQGLAYTGGVVLSFLALGALMLALRAGGAQLGWGFQLQSPGVVALLAALFTLVGLNLAGVFEFGAWLPSGLASVQARHPVIDAGLSGVLAVAIASPCTAPFMGASLGFAVALPATQALAIFAALGLPWRRGQALTRPGTPRRRLSAAGVPASRTAASSMAMVVSPAWGWWQPSRLVVSLESRVALPRLRPALDDPEHRTGQGRVAHRPAGQARHRG